MVEPRRALLCQCRDKHLVKAPNGLWYWKGTGISVTPPEPETEEGIPCP